jgi:Flp pilus assembly protein TadD
LGGLKKFASVVTGKICCLFLLPSVALPQSNYATAGYVGSRACAGCHAEIFRTYSKTAMGNASGKVEPGAAKQPLSGSFLHVLSGTKYSLQADAGGLSLEYNKPQLAGEPPISGKRKLEYYIGSGTHARGYLYRYEEMLFQSPVAYYQNRQQWDMAPGYETEHSIFLGRKIEQTCLDCHSTGRTAQEPFAEGAVSCERCHGPGSAHIAKFTPHHEEAPLGILNPPKLQPVQRDSVCAQCHLTGEARVQKQNASAFVAGDRLTDHFVPFIQSSPDPDNLKVIGHFEGLWLSRCKRMSGDKLWCGTCHDPHQEPEAEKKPAYFRAKCFTCHTESSCTAKASERTAKADNCIACHMPKRQAVDGLHAAFTDHSLRRYGNDMPAAKSNTQELVPFWPGTASTRDLALAYMDVASRTHKEADYLRAYAALEKAVQEAGDDAEVLSHLAYLKDFAGSPAEAVQLYQRAFRLDPQNTLALTNLGQHLAMEGKAAEAIPLWQHVVKLDPGLAAPSLNLAYAFLQTGDVSGARKAIESLLYFNPDFEKGLALKKQVEH